MRVCISLTFWHPFSLSTSRLGSQTAVIPISPFPVSLAGRQRLERAQICASEREQSTFTAAFCALSVLPPSFLRPSSVPPLRPPCLLLPTFTLAHHALGASVRPQLLLEQRQPSSTRSGLSSLHTYWLLATEPLPPPPPPLGPVAPRQHALARTISTHPCVTRTAPSCHEDAGLGTKSEAWRFLVCAQSSSDGSPRICSQVSSPLGLARSKNLCHCLSSQLGPGLFHGFDATLFSWHSLTRRPLGELLLA